MQLDERDKGYLLDMLQHAQGVVRAVEGKNLAQYAADENLRLAVERRIEIIGEAARRVSHTVQEAHDDIPWRKIVAQRNVLAHEYGEVEDEIMWHVASVSIPELIALLEPLVPPFPQDDSASSE